jgi:hypothetical protein
MMKVAARAVKIASRPVLIHTIVVTKPETNEATTPHALNLFQKNERMTAGANEQPMPAQAQWTSV